MSSSLLHVPARVHSVGPGSVDATAGTSANRVVAIYMLTVYKGITHQSSNPDVEGIRSRPQIFSEVSSHLLLPTDVEF